MKREAKTTEPNEVYVEGLDELIREYRHSLERVELDGPTRFRPVCQHILGWVKRQMAANLPVYHVLLILTDGVIHDMRETIDVIVEASTMPLSIVIIGIGDANFSNMEILDADEFVLTDSKTNEAARDIVQFVKFRDYNKNTGLLAE